MDDISDFKDDLNARDKDSESSITIDPETKDKVIDEPQFEEPIASPAVLAEENSSGSAPEGESMDIDEELAKVGLKPEKFDEEV